MVHVTLHPLDSSTFVSRVSPAENGPIYVGGAAAIPVELRRAIARRRPPILSVSTCRLFRLTLKIVPRVSTCASQQRPQSGN